MLTGDQYRQSIRDGRKSYFQGNLVEDAAAHPLFGKSVDWVARTYDRGYSKEAGASHSMYSVPRSPEELQEQMDLLMASDPLASSTAGCMALRSITGDLYGMPVVEFTDPPAGGEAP